MNICVKGIVKHRSELNKLLYLFKKIEDFPRETGWKSLIF